MDSTKFQMSDGEIKKNWEHSQQDVPQVRCLAELNAVSVPVMHQKLKELGLTVPDMNFHKSKTNPAVPHELAYGLYLQHLKDGEIGEKLGFSATAIRKWRESWDYPDISTDGRKTTAISVKQLADMISQISKVCPGALVAVNGAPVTNIQVTASMELGARQRVDVTLAGNEVI